MLDCTRIPIQMQEAAVAEKATGCTAFEVTGWRTAERNLDLPAQWLAGFFFGVEASYIEQGGIEGAVARALHMPQSPWRVVARKNHFGGAQVILSLEKKGGCSKNS